MALPIVHLLAAWRWAQPYPEYSRCPEFYLGAVAPDGIYIRYGEDKSRKNEYHLGNWGHWHPERILEYWRERNAPFDIGYGVHCLTDAVWQIPRRFPELLDPDGTVNAKAYYNDAFQTDFALLAALPEAQESLALMQRAVPPEDHPFLTGGELAAWRDLLADRYRQKRSYPEPVRCLTEERALRFVDEAKETLENVYRRRIEP